MKGAVAGAVGVRLLDRLGRRMAEDEGLGAQVGTVKCRRVTGRHTPADFGLAI
jgi:hypothetical protein